MTPKTDSFHTYRTYTPMSEGRFIITTTLEGYINALKPSGKFNNCTISFKIPAEQIPEFDKAYEKAIAVGKNKAAGKRVSEELPKWEENGLVKYSYGGDSSSPMFPWVDTDGNPIDLDTQIWKGTVVRLIIDLRPYFYATKVGCSFKVRGAQVVKLVSSGGSDSGGLDKTEVANLFGKVDGFKADSPNFEPTEDPGDGPAGYTDDDEDLPF